MRAKAGQHGISTKRHVRMMPKGLPLVHIRNVALDHGSVEGVECVEDRDRGVRERSRVDDKTGCDLTGFMDPVDDLVLAVALMKAQFQAQLAGERAAVALDIGQSL